ncbi:hypothetical protein GALMADRAFT_1130016 [Galerina marginata CBS 339.88]|uniref:Uncharacterized protein n=1 Tax=Galerina marginata (strain CBS 339.88) TaxID=685588 RepID=A0A067SHD9_GALM3|nr:hypothetical protein GALMADRAFT_1130016 [Galerina marginata CBS 339.88]
MVWEGLGVEGGEGREAREGKDRREGGSGAVRFSSHQHEALLPRRRSGNRPCPNVCALFGTSILNVVAVTLVLVNTSILPFMVRELVNMVLRTHTSTPPPSLAFDVGALGAPEPGVRLLAFADGVAKAEAIVAEAVVDIIRVVILIEALEFGSTSPLSFHLEPATESSALPAIPPPMSMPASMPASMLTSTSTSFAGSLFSTRCPSSLSPGRLERSMICFTIKSWASVSTSNSGTMSWLPTPRGPFQRQLRYAQCQCQHGCWPCLHLLHDRHQRPCCCCCRL